jgi:hypothetical protein
MKMSKAQHTPGPWKADPFGRDTFIVKDYGDGSGRHIATVRHPGDVPVILAAPELLEVLEDVLRRIEGSELWWMDCPDRGGFDTDRISAVIVKATGT